MRIAVCVKQVIDPEAPPSAFKIDDDARRVIPPPGIAPVVNGFDLNAVEAALRIRDAGSAEIVIISAGTGFVMDVMKRPLSMGADSLVLIDDPALAEIDHVATARILAAAIRKKGPFDLVLCGRQASDWDNAQVPAGMAELLEAPCVSFARRIEIIDGKARIERALIDGHQVVETDLPALVTVTNELGEPRYPNLRGIMAASKKAPEVLALDDLDLDVTALAPSLVLRRLFIPETSGECEMIEGDDDADAGRRLALRLRELKLV